MPQVLRQVITPHDQFLRDVFNTQRSYYIDIYQREYRWDRRQVETLLNDIEMKFEAFERNELDPDRIREDVLNNFEPYFMNTYLSHTTSSNTAIVDGQQRLTTFLLILIKIYQIILNVETTLDLHGRTFSSKVLQDFIFETDDFGGTTKFKLSNQNREDALNHLIKDDAFNPKDETQRKITDNYKLISSYFDKFFSADDDIGYDLNKITYYLTYLLDRVSIVEIKIENQNNVAMVFEVVNDRGLGLKTYEILKGKLIGSLGVTEKEECNRIWTELQEKYFNTTIKNSTESMLDLDNFFKTWLRSKFADSEDQYESFETDYHYTIYGNDKIRKYFGDFHDEDVLYNRITDEIRYYADLYLRLRSDYNNEYLLYNKLLDQNQQYLLILSSMQVDDPEESDKIEAIASKFDQMHTVLRLLNAYESNLFQRTIYELNKMLRSKSAEQCKNIIGDMLIKKLKEKQQLSEDFNGTVDDIFEYQRFRLISNHQLNFSKYILMRIDRWLSSMLDKPGYCGDSSLEELEERFNRNNRKRYGLHLEHIYAHNKANIAQFTDDQTGIFDETAFNQTRNLLGMVLLLKDKMNLSSGAELYKDKINTYGKSNFVWNELLVNHLHGVDESLLPEFLKGNHILPTDTGAFPRNAVTQRQQLIFNAIKAIWSGI